MKDQIITSGDSMLNRQNEEKTNGGIQSNSVLPHNNGSENSKECTIFRKYSVLSENKSILEITKWIESNKYQIEIDEIQLLIAERNLEQDKKKKQPLPAFTPSAIFKEKWLLNHIEQNNGIIQLNFDKLRPEELEKAFKIISQSSYIILCFRSPSGKDFKVFAEASAGKSHQNIAYSQVKQYYENETNFKADDQCKDITRLCFMRDDPHLYRNLDFKKFKVNILLFKLNNN